MSSCSAKEIHNSLVEILELERDTLLTGQLAVIDRIKYRKDELADQLMSHTTQFSAVELQHLQALSRRNNMLYESALNGLGAAKARVEGWHEAQHGLKTYTSQRKSVAQKSPFHTHEKRA